MTSLEAPLPEFSDAWVTVARAVQKLNGPKQDRINSKEDQGVWKSTRQINALARHLNAAISEEPIETAPSPTAAALIEAGPFDLEAVLAHGDLIRKVAAEVMATPAASIAPPARSL